MRKLFTLLLAASVVALVMTPIQGAAAVAPPDEAPVVIEQETGEPAALSQPAATNPVSGEFDVYSYNIYGQFVGNLFEPDLAKFNDERADTGQALAEEVAGRQPRDVIIGLQEDWQSLVDCFGPFWTRSYIQNQAPYVSLPGDTRRLANSLLPCDLPLNDGLNLYSSFPFVDHPLAGDVETVSVSEYAYGLDDVPAGINPNNLGYRLYRETFTTRDDIPEGDIKSMLRDILPEYWPGDGLEDEYLEMFPCTYNPFKKRYWTLRNANNCIVQEAIKAVSLAGDVIDALAWVVDRIFLLEIPIPGVGKLDLGGWNCLACKGFMMTRVKVTPEFTIDVYNVHTGPDRTPQVTQLLNAIKEYSGGPDEANHNAVIVMGDTNLHWFENPPYDDAPDPNSSSAIRDQDLFRKVKRLAGLTSACQQVDAPGPVGPNSLEPGRCINNWPYPKSGAIDQVFYRGNNNFSLEVNDYYMYDWDLSDHMPIRATLEWKSLAVPEITSFDIDTNPVVENEETSVTIEWTDHEPGDGFEITVNWGDEDVVGNDVVIVPPNADPNDHDYSLVVSHRYLDDIYDGRFADGPKVWDVFAWVHQLPGGAEYARSDHLFVNVVDAPPELSPIADLVVDYSSGTGTAALEAAFTNMGPLDAHTASVDWGDGGPAEAVDAPSGRVDAPWATEPCNPEQFDPFDDDYWRAMMGCIGAGSLTATHTYTTRDTYTATVTVTDDDGGTDTATVTVYPLSNVTVSVSKRGDLIITGDDWANHITLTGVGPDAVSVDGHEGTYINGQPGPLTFAGVTRDVRIAMNGGDDWVNALAMTMPRKLKADGGAGDNELRMEGVTVLSDVTVENGPGADLFALEDSTVRGDLNIDNGDGAGDELVNGGDTFVLGSRIEGTMKIKNKGGTDRMELTESEILGDLKIDNGNGTDTADGPPLGGSTLLKASLVGGDIAIKAKNGVDRIDLVGMTVGGDLAIKTGKGGSAQLIESSALGSKVSVKTQDGADEITIGDGVAISGKTTIKTGKGDDIVIIGAAQFNDKFKADGGKGIDRFDDQGGTFPPKSPKLKSFEIV